MTRVNEYGQLIGKDISDWKAPAKPTAVTLTGHSCRLEPLDSSKHTDDLFAAFSQSADNRDWTYLIIDRYESTAACRNDIENAASNPNVCAFAIIDLVSGKAVGMLSLTNISPNNGSIEVGRIRFSPLLKQSVLSTETQFLLMEYVFDTLGYRRYQWKCDSLNEPSRKAATRLGFTFEAIFRQHEIVKGLNRDTAFYSIIDEDWPMLKTAFQAWLAPENFDENGRQIRSLQSFRK